MPPNFKLSILCHPKFKSDVKFIDSRIQQICFDFSSSKIEDYYTFLKNQSIVICGGTSVLLDCAFTNTAVIILNFDVIKQDYWKSAQRCFDFMDHTKTLISKFDYKVARTENEIISFIKKQINGIKPIQSAYYFLGTNYQAFHNLDFKSIVSFLSDKSSGK